MSTTTTTSDDEFVIRVPGVSAVEERVERVERKVDALIELLSKTSPSAGGPMVGVEEAADKLGRSPTWLRQYRSSGIFLEGEKFQESDLFRWEAARAAYGVKREGGEFVGDLDSFQAWLEDHDPVRRVRVRVRS